MKDLKIPLAILTLNPLVWALDLLGLTVVSEFRVMLGLANLVCLAWMWLILLADSVE